MLESLFFNFLPSVRIILFLTILTQTPSLNWCQNVTIFMELSVNFKKTIEKFFTHKFFVIVWIAMLRSSYRNFLRSFQILLFLTNFIQMTSWIRHEKNTPFMEFSVNGKKQSKNLSYRILVIFSIGLLRSSYFNFLGSIQIVLFLTNSFQLPSLYPHEKLTPFVELSVNGKKKLKNLAYKFFVITSFALLRSSYFNFLRPFQILLIWTNSVQMPF